MTRVGRLEAPQVLVGGHGLRAVEGGEEALEIAGARLEVPARGT
jgi:predicted dienelactone hydrolase